MQGAINFWNFGARMEAAGMKTLLPIGDAAAALGLDPQTPLLGYVVRGEVLKASPDLAGKIATASRMAKEKLAADPVAWDRIRPMMNAATRQGFRGAEGGLHCRNTDAWPGG